MICSVAILFSYKSTYIIYGFTIHNLILLWYQFAGNVSGNSFPKNDPERRKRWIINMKWKDWNPQHHHRVCSIHFEDKYICRMDKRQRLTPDAVPTIFDFPENFQKKKVRWNQKCI